jgi:heat shock protein HslJ
LNDKSVTENANANGRFDLRLQSIQARGWINNAENAARNVVRRQYGKSAINKLTGSATVSNVATTHVNFQGVIIRLGLNYHFNFL